MVIAAYLHKANFLLNHREKHLVRDVANAVRRTFALLTTHCFPEALVKAAELDVTYCVMRHLYWIDAELFSEIVIDHLNSEFRLPRSVSEQVLAAALSPGNIRSRRKKLGDDTGDKDFLRYVFIESATAANENALIMELGLGKNILRNIKLAAENMAASRGGGSNQIEFSSDIDTLISKIMSEISEEIKITPWIIDQYRLQYILTDTNGTITDYDAENHKVFQLLLYIGKIGNASTIQMESWCKKLFPCTGTPASSDSLQTATNDDFSFLLRLLEKAQLLYMSQKGRRDVDSTWKLSTKGMELTAEAFACKFLRVANPPLKELPHLNSSYQIALIKRAPNHLAVEMLSLLKSNFGRFSPQTLQVLIKRLATHHEHEKIFADIAPLLQKEDHPWLKAAICSVLPNLNQAGEVAALLKTTLENTTSSRVKAAAHEALCRLT